jgi:hypothetical protein
VEPRGLAFVEAPWEIPKRGIRADAHRFLKIIRQFHSCDIMGIFDWLKGSEDAESAPVPQAKAFRISYEFSPLRLKAHKDSKVSMSVTVENTSGKKQLSSVDIEIGKGSKVGFDVTSMQKHHEERLGELEAGATKTFSVSVHSGPTTKAGDVPMKITAYSHYLNYNKVLEQAQKGAKLRVI